MLIVSLTYLKFELSSYPFILKLFLIYSESELLIDIDDLQISSTPWFNFIFFHSVLWSTVFILMSNLILFPLVTFLMSYKEIIAQSKVRVIPFIVLALTLKSLLIGHYIHMSKSLKSLVLFFVLGGHTHLFLPLESLLTYLEDHIGWKGLSPGKLFARQTPYPVFIFAQISDVL